MKALNELCSVVIIAVVVAAVAWTFHGDHHRTLACVPDDLKADEICLAEAISRTGVVWIDARPRSRWQKDGLSDSLLWNLDPTEDVALMEAEVAARLIDASMAVVYCDDETCGASRQIATRVRELDLVPEVKVLYGGWKAIADAELVKDSN